MEEEEKNAELVGRSVRKYFEGHGFFAGRVVSYNRERKYFRVKYADGDREEVELHELKEILVDGGDSAPAKRPRGRPRKVVRGSEFFSRTKGEEGAKAADQGHGELIQATNFKDLIAQEVFKVLKRKRQEGNESARPRGRPRKKIRQEEKPLVASEKEEKTLVSEKEGKPLVTSEKEEETFENKDGEVFEKKEHEDDKPLKPVPHRRKSVPLDRPCPLRHIPVKQREKELQEQVSDKAQAEATTCQVEGTDLNIPLLPPSSVDLNIPSESILHLFSAYTFLRSFSWVIFLSPFSLREFIRCMGMKEANPLIDQIHLSLLLLLRQHLESLAGDGNDSAIRCLKCRDWTLLDAFSWPSFLVAYLLHGNYRLEGKEKLLDIGILHGEYYGLEVGSKIDILSFICDRVLDTDEIRSELSKRSNGDSEIDMKTAMEDTQLEPVSRRESRRTRRSSPSDNSELVDPPACVEQRPTPDWNTDDCVLCGMDGNLICCDGCPAAYHSRCVGLSRSMLPEGDWYCPECTLQTIAMEETRPRKGVRGFECLGVDTYGRRYVAVVEHLFISKSSSLDSSYVCYGSQHISQVLELLDSTGSLSARLKAIIMQHWSVPDDSLVNNETFSSPVENAATEACIHKDGIEGEQIVPPRPAHDIGLSKPKFRGNQETYFEACSYVNQYAQGGLAALAASNLAEKSTNRRAAVQRTQIFEQIKAFSRAPVQFYWPSVKKKRMEGPRDRCGWCFVCKNLSKKKGCLLNTAAGKLVAGAALVSGGLRPIRKGVNYLPSLTAYLLYMEERLNGFFLGCSWESIDQRKCWRRRVECAGLVKQVKSAMIEFGSSLRHLALTKDWSMCAEDSPRLIPLGAANGTVLFSSFKRSGGRRRKKVEAAEPIKIFPGGGIWGVQWRRGGKLVRRFMDWETLPTATLRRAARQGGMRKVPGLLYNDNFEVPRRTVRCAWLSRVEASFSVSELAIQVRYLDTLIRWSDLSVPEEVKAMFQDSIIRERAMEDDAFKYLVDTSKTEEELLEMKPDIVSCPLKFLKALVGDEGICANRVWLPETHLPLCLVRDFEEKCLSQVRSAIGRKGERQTPRVSKGAKLKAILSRLHALDAKKKIPKCEHCSLDMVASDIVNCRECQGEFHQRCMSRDKSTSKMCQSCSVVKKNSKRSRRVATREGAQQEEEAMEAARMEKPPLLVYFRRRKVVTAVERFRDKVLRKKRSKRPVNSCGVRWKLGSEVTYRRDKVVFPGQRRGGGVCCGICNQPYDAKLLYIGCEHCQEWFHGRAIGIRRSNIGRVEAFKCFKCRKKGGPYCPYARDRA